MKNKPKSTAPQPFRLSGSATARLNNYLAQIRKGIASVCELYTHDTAKSMSQAAFEERYIEMILAQTVTAVSASIRSMTEALAVQKEKEHKSVFNPQG